MAALNLVRKRPTREFQAHVSGQAGAWDRYRSEADVSDEPLSIILGARVSGWDQQDDDVDEFTGDVYIDEHTKKSQPIFGRAGLFAGQGRLLHESR